MKKLLEQNLAAVIVLIVFALAFSSCGIQFGNYERWKEVYGNDSCQTIIDEREYEFTSAYNNCENCDEVD
tara:strand:+ start:597 stop:806 length:210 start_codon:yes stop_codon:yes gene_type:complete